ncbi:MAG: protein translocase subunit SecF [Rickettsiaceae bacterium]|nr:protein translocase subunit SecF [Rickettsiaceae bacterium]
MQLYPLRMISDDTSFPFMRIRKFSFAFSIFLSILSLFATYVYGVNFGIDFTGGIVIEARSNEPLDLGVMRSALLKLDIGDVSIQTLENDKNIMIRVGCSSTNSDISKTTSSIKLALKNVSKNELEFRKIDFVGPQVGYGLILSGVKALLLCFIAVMIYVWFRFEWQFGVGVLVALIHDAIITFGFIAITQLDFSLSSIAAILTVIGYSVNDSVVIYDRIRENLRRYSKKNIESIIDLSTNETLSRTTMTVFTTLIANLALIIWGGSELKSFSMTVFFGILAGTYSSIFISAPILKLLGLGSLTKGSI